MLQQYVAGYWLKGPPGKPVDPASCDIVVYYLQGGTYVNDHPGTFLLAALRISETTAECGISVTWLDLSVRWHWAKFPTQVEKAIAEYKYLLDQNIDFSNIAVLSDSGTWRYV